VLTGRDGAITGASGRELLRALPLRWPWLREVISDGDRAEAVGQIPGFPVVAKVEGIAHRQQVSAVWQNVADARTARSVLELFAGSFGYPLSLAEQIPHGREFVLGWQRRPGGEDILMFGQGGSDVGGAVQFRLVPLTRRHADSLVREQVSDAAQRTRLIALILALQDLVAGFPAGGDIREIDLNPITFDRDGELIALDWKIFVRPAEGTSA
jgi:ATP-grasp domain